MFFGFLMTIGSTILFAFSESAIMMLVSRAIQGTKSFFKVLINIFFKVLEPVLAPFLDLVFWRSSFKGSLRYLNRKDAFMWIISVKLHQRCPGAWPLLGIGVYWIRSRGSHRSTFWFCGISISRSWSSVLHSCWDRCIWWNYSAVNIPGRNSVVNIATEKHDGIVPQSTKSEYLTKNILSHIKQIRLHRWKNKKVLRCLNCLPIHISYSLLLQWLQQIFVLHFLKQVTRLSYIYYFTINSFLGLPIWMIEAGSEKWMLGMPLLAMNVTFILTNNLAPSEFTCM